MDEACNTAAEEGTPTHKRPSLAGMFPFLQKQQSMDTDQSDRHRHRGGGKVKPGKHVMRSSSGDVMDAMTPPAGDASPSAAWLVADHESNTTPQGWPGSIPALQTTPTRGLFSKLLSKKQKHRRSASPAGPRSPSLGTSSNGSQSPTNHSAEHLPACVVGFPPATPPSQQLEGGDDALQAEDAGFGSCYSTPIGSESMQSPTYGGDTLDLRQVMAMRQDMPDVFTPGFNELLQQAGRQLPQREPDTPPDMQDPTVALLTGVQLAQAGHMYDVPAMLLDPVCEASNSEAASPKLEQQQATAVSEGLASVERGQQQAVHVNDIELSVGVMISSNAAQAEAAAEASRPRSSASVASDAASKLVEQQAPSSTAEEEPARNANAAAADKCEEIAERSATSESEQETGASATAEELCADVPAAEERMGSAVDVPASSKQAEGQTAAADGPVAPQAIDSLSKIMSKVHLQDASDLACAGAEAAMVEEEYNYELDAATAETDQTPAKAAPVWAEPTGDLPSNSEADAELPGAPAEPMEPQSTESTAMSPVQKVPTPMSPVQEVHGLPAAATAGAVAVHEDEFALLERQVAMEAAFEAEADEFSLLEQQVAAEAAAEALDDEFAELERQAAAESEESAPPAAGPSSSSSLSRTAVGNTDTVSALLATDEQFPPSFGAPDGIPLPLPAADDSFEEPKSPQALQHSVNAPASESSHDSPVYAAAAAASTASSARKSARRSPMHLVRESIPLFLSDPSRAMGSPLALEPEEDSLDAQDMQQLSGGTQYRTGGVAGPRLLAHGGAQRVNVGSGLSGGFLSSLEPVAESSFNSAGIPSPIMEGSPTFDCNGSGSSSKSDSRCGVAAAGSPGEHSMLHPRQLSSSPRDFDATTPAHLGAGVNLAATPGSVYSTPTLALGAVGGYQQGTSVTPQSGVSVGSAIRPTGAVGGVLDLSPAMPDSMPDASPTLMLMAGQGIDLTPAHQDGEANTPSLLDARAASPSAVYATRFMATPFRGALAALPMDAALAAPLVDSSPFSLRDGMDTVCLADEAQRVAENLAAAVAGGGYSPGPAATPAVHTPQAAATPSSAAASRGLDRPGSPTEELRDLHVVMLTKQLAEVQKRLKDLEAENERLKEQVEIYEFEKTELNSQEEMEKQARQYAEEQLQNMQVEMQQLMQAKHSQAAQMVSMRQEFEGIQVEAQREHAAMKDRHIQLEATITQLQEDRNEALDKLNLLDMQVTALRSNNSELMGALEAEQQRSAQLEAAMAARDRDIAEAGRVQLEAQNKLERAMEQMIAANTAKEHVRQKAADEAAKVQQLMAERQQFMAERQQFMAEREKYQHLKQKYAQKSALAKEAEQRLQAKEAENQELMSMCDQLLQQQEASRRSAR